MADYQTLKAAGFTDQEIYEQKRSVYKEAGFSDAEIDAHFGRTPTLRDEIYDFAGSALQGLTFGLGDEITAGLQALSPNITYDEALAQQRGDMRAFAERRPVASTATEIGAAIVPSLLTGGGGVAFKGLQSAPKVNRLAQVLYGGGKMAPTGIQRVGQGIKQGAVTGGLYGAGTAEGGAKERAIAGLQAGGAGAAVGGVTSGLMNALSGAQQAKKAITARPKLAPAEREVRRIISKDMIAPGHMERAATELGQAADEGSPLFLAEAIDRPETFAEAHRYANAPNSRAVAEPAIRARKAGRGGRLESLFDEVSGETSAYKAGRNLHEVASAKMDDILEKRAKVTGPLFEDAIAEAPIMKGEELNRLMNKDQVRRYVRNLAQTEDLPKVGKGEHHSRTVNDVLAELNDDIQLSAKPNERRRLVALKKAIEKEVKKENPALLKARDKYRELSASVDDFDDKAMSVLKALGSKDYDKAGKKIFTMRPEAIENFKKALGKEGAEEFKDVVRARLQDVLDDTSKGRDYLKNTFLAKPMNEKRIQAALGKREFGRIMRGLAKEERFSVGDAKYAPGSKTYFLGSSAVEAASDALKDLWGLGPLYSKYVMPSLPGMDPAKARGVSQILFDPKTGSGALRRIAAHERAIGPAQQRTMQRFGAVERPLVRGSAVGTAKLLEAMK